MFFSFSESFLSPKQGTTHCVKSVRIWGFLLCICPYSLRVWENTNQKTLNTDTFHAVTSLWMSSAILEIETFFITHLLLHQ